jgi:glycosyltransferase involved in cell wall biosynthesis
MQITYILSQYPARSETFIAREMRELARQGHDITIARLRWSDTQSGMSVDSATVLPLPWSPLTWLRGLAWGAVRAPRALLHIGRDLLDARALSLQWGRLLLLALIALSLARRLHQHPTEHLRAHFLDSESIAAHWIARLLDVPYSVTAHTLNTRFSPRLLRRVAEKASFCAGISVEVRDLLTTLAPDQPNVHLVRNGLQVPDAPSTPRLPSPPLRLVAVGRLIEKKGFDVLLEACSLLRAWLRPLRCTLIGDGPLRSALDAQIRRQGLARHVTLAGARPNDDVLRAIRRHDVLVMPSRPTPTGERDGIPTVLIEAMAHGTSVVASAFAGIPELIDHGLTGRLVPPNNPQALARALAATMDRPVQTVCMCRRGRERITRDFNLTREVARLHHLMRQSID